MAWHHGHKRRIGPALADCRIEPHAVDRVTNPARECGCKYRQPALTRPGGGAHKNQCTEKGWPRDDHIAQYAMDSGKYLIAERAARPNGVERRLRYFPHEMQAKR